MYYPFLIQKLRQLNLFDCFFLIVFMIVLSFYPWCTCTAHWTPNSGDMSVLQYDEVKMQKRSESCSSSTSAVTGEMALHWVNGTDLCDLYFRILIRFMFLHSYNIDHLFWFMLKKDHTL